MIPIAYSSTQHSSLSLHFSKNKSGSPFFIVILLILLLFELLPPLDSPIHVLPVDVVPAIGRHCFSFSVQEDQFGD